MNYKKISVESWNRAAIFKHFIDDVRCVLSITTEVDVSDVLAFCKTGGYRFYPTFLYLVSRAINRRDEFRMRFDENEDPVLWNEVSPSYIVFHPEDELFTRLITAYSADFQSFYQSVLSDMDTHKDARGLEVSYSEQNTFDASCLPWLHYSACDLHVFDAGIYLSPIVTWGKYQEFDGTSVMPLTMQVHHAVADGFHVSRFFDDVAHEITGLTHI